ncbi:nitroreductase family protein [Paenibacillus hemerocallicola]|uniref:Nitroreductase family protein n=1 Tax=Paenibacillus hemerocallicola TaxID=1172614 RepID=A0A5C4TIH3_9BACL|nr:nitroreductase family protein [Paenibacillus hemerocallicola]TNJ68270.1 nitroreductase family protein [Paenibacillus hemerocallicola]
MTIEVKQGAQTATNADFISVAAGRRSVRVYDSEWTISKEELQDILKTAIMAPSSSNLQPWRFLVLQNAELKRKLLPIAYNQQQVVEASAVIAVFADPLAYEKAETIYGSAVEAGYMQESVKADFVKRTVQTYGSLGEDRLKSIALVDGGLVSMQLMLAAKAKGYDTVPMGGYDADKFKEAFDVPQRWAPVMLIALGKAAKEGHPTTRLPLEEVAFWNSIEA